MVHLTVRDEILNIRTSLAPHTNEFRLGKLESKLQTYLALLQASLLGSFQRMFLALHVCCRYPEVVNPSSMEAKSKEVTLPFVVQALSYDCQCLLHLSTRYKVMGSPSVQDGARHFSPAELDVTLVTFGSSSSEGLSERWMIVRRDKFSIGINQSKNNSRNIDNSINSCFQISHYMPQLQKEQY